MKITKALLGEHGVFYAQFDHIESSVTSDMTLPEMLSQAALLEAGLAGHAQIEEELLFQKLDPVLGGGGPLAVMRMEHQEIEDTLMKLPDRESDEEVRKLLLHLVEVARGHFAKEEQILFPLAEQTLPSEQLISLGSEWAKRRRVMI
jgi:iron-sulfur cluster repair protein YtfE (RIC family)